MKLLFSMLFVWLFMACKGQDTKPDLQALAKAGTETYFIESKDTISIHGPNHITREIVQDRIGEKCFATWIGIINQMSRLLKNNTIH